MDYDENEKLINANVEESYDVSIPSDTYNNNLYQTGWAYDTQAQLLPPVVDNRKNQRSNIFPFGHLNDQIQERLALITILTSTKKLRLFWKHIRGLKKHYKWLMLLIIFQTRLPIWWNWTVFDSRWICIVWILSSIRI